MQAMWQNITKPDILIYLAASFPVSTARRQLNWQEKDHDEQLRRLAHARQHANLFIDTDDLTPEQVLQKVLDYLKEMQSDEKIFCLFSRVCLSLSLLASFHVQFPADNNHTDSPLPDHLQYALGGSFDFKSGLVASEQSVLDELPNASVYHLEFNIADDLYHVTGTEEVRYTNTEDCALNEVRVPPFPNILGGEMTVSNLNVDGQSVTPKYELENSLLIVPSAKAAGAGSKHDLSRWILPSPSRNRSN